MRHLLNRAATVRTYAANGFDAYGNTTYATSDDGPYPCRLEMSRSTEQTLDRETVTTSVRAFFMPEAAITAGDVLIIDDVEYRVDGDPLRRDGLRTQHHLEANLVEVRA